MDIKQSIKRQGIPDVLAQAARISTIMERIRSAMLHPTARKVAPKVTALELAQLCEVDKSKITYRLSRGDLPAGEMNGNRREWTMAEAREWVREFRPHHLRPAGAAAATITVASLKGGVGKTVTAMTLAQRLASLSHKVLLVDLDAQGSATTLFGVMPDSEVDPEKSAWPLFAGHEPNLSYAPQSTYWPGIDLIAACPMLFDAEFALPAQQMKDPSFEFWLVLDRGLDALRSEYDVIILDTPPTMSYTTLNALMAGDGVIIPLPPSALDFASSAQFWELFSDLSKQLVKNRNAVKTFEFIDVLLARVETSDAASSVVRQWILEAYGDKVLPIEIPKTSATATATAEFGTVYDLPRGSINAKTLSRARDAYDRMCELVEQQIQAIWTLQLAELEQ